MNRKHEGLPNRIVFFDGVCLLCNWSVRLIRKMDKTNQIYYATLQGVTAQELFNNSEPHLLDSFRYKSGSNVYDGARAVHHLCMDIGGIYKLYAIFLLIPYFIKNWIYRWTSKNRYKFFRKMDVCYMPTTDQEQSHFLP